MAESAWYSWAAGVPVTILEIDQASTALAGQADMGTVTLASPTANPAAISATVLSESGNLNGAYQYVMTETVGAIDGHGNLHPAGQTAAGTASNVVNASDNPIALSVPAPSALAISRTLWRTTGGGSTFYFLVTIVDPQVSTWTDNVADADLGTTTAPTVNSTGTVLQLPVFSAVPGFSATAGTVIAVTVASGTTVLYRSNGSGWLPVPDLDVANIWTAAQTFSGGAIIPAAATFTNSGTYAGTPLVTGLTAGTGISVTNPTSPGTAAVAVNNAPNSALAGPLVTGLTAGTGISVTNPTGVGTATVDVVLSGTTLINSGGVAINLANANTWTGAQTFESATLTGTTTNAGTISGGTVNPASGAVAGNWQASGGSVWLGVPSIPSGGQSAIGWNGIGSNGETDFYNNRGSSPSDATAFIWWTAQGSATTWTNLAQLSTSGNFNANSLSTPAGGPATIGGLLTANGNLALPSTTPDTAAGVVSQSGNQLYIGNGSAANPVGGPLASGTWAFASGTFNVAGGTVISFATIPAGCSRYALTSPISGDYQTQSNGGTLANGQSFWNALSVTAADTGASSALSSATVAGPLSVFDGTYQGTGYFQINGTQLEFVVISSAASEDSTNSPMEWEVW